MAQSHHGPIAWMVKNKVTPNLLMLLLLVGGFLAAKQIKQEVFPEFALDIVTITVPYPGASPEEVEKGIILAIEENIQGLDGIKEYNSIAAEGNATVTIELDVTANRQQIFQDIKQEVDAITTFPDDAEEPKVVLEAIKMTVLQVTLFGKTSEHVLRELAEQTKDRLLQEKGLSQVEIIAARDFEVAVEISQENLRRYKLTLNEVATKIKNASVEIPGGKIKTQNGEILLRTKSRHDWASEFSKIPIISTASGSIIRLGDIATLSETFEDSDRYTEYNGKPSMALTIYRVGEETPISIAEKVRSLMPQIAQTYPTGIEWAISKDRSIVYTQRLELLLKNAFLGLFLVLFLLGTFLEFRLAFWVTMGIPTSFLGTLLFLPSFDISINMISMFAFIVALGIVVDDAIVAGENIYEYREQGLSFVDAAILGTKDIAQPLAFSILTNIVAFSPLLFIPGVMGKIWGVIPTVVIMVFLISWVESLFILPAHLAHSSNKKGSGIFRLIAQHQNFFAKLLNSFIHKIYKPCLQFCLRHRGSALACGLALLILSIGYIKGGRVHMTLMPRVDSDRAVVTATFPLGTPLSEIHRVEKLLENGIANLANKYEEGSLLEGVFSKIVDNQLTIYAFLTSPDIRPLNTKKITEEWRKNVGPVTGLESLLYESDRGGPGGGAALEIELQHRDIATLDRASADLAQTLAQFATTKDINQGFIPGKQQIDLELTATGKALGLTNNDIGRQLRNHFQGAIALSQQRGQNEMTVRVRLPKTERDTAFTIENLLIRTPQKTFVPLREVAHLQTGRAYTTIERRDGKRVVIVSANVEPIGEVNQITATLEKESLPKLLAKYPGLSYQFAGRESDRMESMSSLASGFIFVMLAIYALLAIPFKSYSQPLIVMFAIPFGLIGALIGHIIMGYNISIISMMGLLALSGVIVNDSLVLVDYANKKVRAGCSADKAILEAGVRRFRPIMLTTLTTFCGLAPMIFETSRQAKFMIPMAISLGFGILFVTVIALLLVPALYLLVEDGKSLFGRKFRH